MRAGWPLARDRYCDLRETEEWAYNLESYSSDGTIKAHRPVAEREVGLAVSNTGNDWIAEVLDGARAVVSVGDDAVAELEQQLTNTLKECALSQGELNGLARLLLKSMVKSAADEDAGE